MHFWWYDNVLMKREKKWVSWRWNSLGMITNSLRVLELNAYETLHWEWEWCFIQVLFYSIWLGSLGNSAIKLSTETGLVRKRRLHLYRGRRNYIATELRRPVSFLSSCSRSCAHARPTLPFPRALLSPPLHVCARATESPLPSTAAESSAFPALNAR
jgi:hypothetical protein